MSEELTEEQLKRIKEAKERIDSGDFVTEEEFFNSQDNVKTKEDKDEE